MSEKPASTLWTRDFTIITAGSVVSMFGNSMSGFAMSLMVLDISKSTLLFSIYMAMYTLPQLFMPILSGALLGRFSRKKTIYTLDFISSGMFAFLALLLDFEECFHHFVHGYVAFQVVSLVEVTLGIALGAAKVNEVDTVPETTHHSGEVVLCTYTKRTCAEACCIL